MSSEEVWSSESFADSASEEEKEKFNLWTFIKKHWAWFVGVGVTVFVLVIVLLAFSKGQASGFNAAGETGEDLSEF